MNIFKRLFKSETKILKSATFKLVPLNQVGSDEKIRNMLVEYLIAQHGKEEAKRIIDNSNYGICELIPGDMLVSLHAKNDECFDSFSINGDRLEKREIIDKESKEGKFLHNSK